MKKKNLLLVAIIVLVISLVSVFVSCKKDENPIDVKPAPEAGINATAFFTAVANVSECDITIYVKSSDGTTVYSRDAKGKESDPYGIGFGSSKFTGTASGLTYTASDFEDDKIVEDIVAGTNVYSAKIASPKDYLGISTGDVKDATVSMTMDSNNAITIIVLKYTHTIDGYVYNTEIRIEP